MKRSVLAQGILDLLETQRANGAITDYEVAQQRSNVATQRATLAGLEQNERTTLDALAVLLGRPPQGFVVQGNTLAAIALPPVTAGLPSELLLRRPDIRAAEANLRAANFDVGAARAARFPSLDLTGRIGTQSASTGLLFDPGTMVYSMAASLTAPIFQAAVWKAASSCRARRSWNWKKPIAPASSPPSATPRMRSAPR